MPPEIREDRLDRFERRASIPMLILSLVFITVVVLPYATTLSPSASTALDRLALVIWVIYMGEYAVRFALARDRVAFVRRNVLDLVAVALPMLRALRLVRAVRLLRLLGTARVQTAIARLLRRSRRQFGRHRLVFSSIVIALMTLGATVVTHAAESDTPGANLTTFAAALWWAVQVVTTVGAADGYPVTALGRISAVVLMVVGIGLFGLVAASLASRFVFRGDEEGTHSGSDGRVDLRGLAERLDGIEAELRALRAERHAGERRRGGDRDGEAL